MAQRLDDCDVDEDAATIDYETAEEEEDWYAGARSMHTEYRKWRKQKPKTPEELVSDLKAFMQHCVLPDEVEDNEDDPCDFEQICADCYSASNCMPSDDQLGYVELELSPEMSKLYVPGDLGDSDIPRRQGTRIVGKGVEEG